MSDQVSGDTGRTALLATLRELAADTAPPSDDRLRQTETAIVAGLALVALEELERRRALAPEPSGVPPEEGGPVARFAGLMDALEQRFPDPTPLAGEPPELRYLAAIDRIRERATTEVERVARLTVEECVMRLDGNWQDQLREDTERVVACVVARLSGATPKEEAR